MFNDNLSLIKQSNQQIFKLQPTPVWLLHCILSGFFFNNIERGSIKLAKSFRFAFYKLIIRLYDFSVLRLHKTVKCCLLHLEKETLSAWIQISTHVSLPSQLICESINSMNVRNFHHEYLPIHK